MLRKVKKGGHAINLILNEAELKVTPLDTVSDLHETGVNRTANAYAEHAVLL